jgi:biopolymer transport protein ExbD
MRVPPAASSRGSIPAIPFANVVLLLTLVFPIAGLSGAALTSVSLPIARHRVPVEPGSVWIVVTERRGGGAGALTYQVSDGASPSRELADVEAVVLDAARASREGDRPVVIRADARLRYGILDEVIDRLRQAGVENVLLETGEGEP